MDDLQRQTARLRFLADELPTAGRRSEALDALQSKFEGIQAAALDVLGRWGGPDSVAALRRFLVEAFSREAGWSVRSVAIRNLIPLVTAADVPWVLDLFFGLRDVLTKHELLQLVIALPPEAARSRLTAELKSSTPSNRQAAVKAIGNMPYPDRRALIQRLRDDPDTLVSQSAKILAKDA